jgi:autotransporter-associated beta strand protein
MKRKFALVRTRASRRFVLSSMFTGTIVVTMAPVASTAADLYWDRTAGSNIWATAGNWSTENFVNADPAAAPGAADNVIFNASALITNQQIDLNANHAALGIQSVSSGTVLLLGSGDERTLTLGTGGITKTGTGALTIGSAATENQGVRIALAANQTWTNDAAGEIVIFNDIAGAFALNYASNTGNGIFRLGAFTEAGATDFTSTYSGLTTIQSGATVIAQGNTAFGSNAAGTIIESGGTLNLGGTLAANGLNLGTEAITVSGAGVGGLGAIINTGTNGQQNAIQGVVNLAGDTTFGGTQRWDIRNGTLNGGGFKLTKTGSNSVFLSGTGKIGTALDQLIVQQGEFVVETGAVALTSNISNGVLVQPASAVTAAFRSWGNYVDHTANITLDSSFSGSTAKLTVQNGYTTHSGTVTATGDTNNLEVAANQIMNVTGVLAGTGTVNKTEAGTLLLNNGGNTHSGVFNLNVGILGGTGTLSSSALNVASGTTLSPGLVGAAGTLSVTNSIVSSGTNTAVFNLGTASDRINVGTLTQEGTTNIVIAPGAGYAPGSYTLFDYTTLDGFYGFGGFSLAANHIDGTLVNDGSAIKLQVNSASVPTWSGTSNGIWTAGSITNPILPNFTFAGRQVEFVNNDAVLFDDTATGTTTIATNGAVVPSMTRFNNSTKDYTINGAISGNGVIVKDGSGTTTLLSTPTNLGGLDINAGTLQLGGESFSASYTAGSIDIAAGATLAVKAGAGGTVANLGLNGGTTITGSGTILLNSTQSDLYHNFTADRGDVRNSGDMTGFTGNIVINDGNRLTASTVNALGNAASITINNGGALLVSAALNYGGTVTASGLGWKETAGSLGAIRLQNGGILSGPVNLVGDTRMSAYSNTTGTISGVISGAGANVEYGLRQIANTGSGTLTISNPANTYTGNTSIIRANINAATIANSGLTSSLGTGSVISMESGSLVLTGPGAMTTNRAIQINQGGQGGGNLSVSDPTAVLTYTGAITNGNSNFPISTLTFSQTLSPDGTSGGTVVLNTASPIRVSGSTIHRTNLTLAGSTQFTVDWATTGTAAAPLGVPGALSVGNNQSAANSGPVTLTIQDTATLTTYGEFDVGNANSGVLQTTTVNQTAGTVNALRGGFTMGGDNRAMRIGHWNNNNASYNLSGGTLNAPNGYVAVGWDGTGNFNQSGGTANVAGLRFGNSTTTGIGTVNLTGGILNVGRLGMSRAGASATFNFDGGTYRATDHHTIGSNIVINLQGGGGTIDTNGFNVNSASALLQGTGPGTLTKTGAGEFNVPAGISSMTGILSVNGGSFGGAGEFTNATVNVNSGGTLAGNLIVSSAGGLVVASGGTVSPGANGGADTGILTASSAAFTAGSKIQVSGAFGDSLSVTGALSGSTTISVVPNGFLSAGTIDLVTYGTNSLAFTTSLPHLTGATVTNNPGSGAIQLTFTGQETLTWSGTGGAVWDTTTNNTWKIGATGVNYLQGDLVKFDDSSAVGSIAVTAAGVTPADVYFDNSTTAYTLTGGGIGGGGALTKDGTATVILANNNSYSGSTTVNNGILQIGNGGTTGTLGRGAVNLNGGTLSFNRSDTSKVTATISGGGIVRSDGNGTTILEGANSYSGGTVISKGTLTGVTATSFGSGTITLNDAATGASNTALTFDPYTSDTAITIANPIVVTNNGTGTVSIGGSERSLRAQGTLFTGTISLGRNVTFLGEFDRTTFSGAISGTADTITIARSPGLDAGISGRVTWDATNTFTPSTAAFTTIQILEGAILQMGVGSGVLDQIPDTAAVNVQAGGVFQMGRTSDGETIGNLSGAGTVRSVLNAGLALTFGTADNTTFSGVINGGNQLSFIKQGSGTATWSGILDNPTGNIVVSAGTMVLAKDSTPTVHALGGNSTVNSGATLKLGGTFANTRPEEDGRNNVNTAPRGFQPNYVDQIYNGTQLTVNAGGILDMNGRSEAMNGFQGAGTVRNTVAGTTSTLYVGANNAGLSFTGILEDGAGKLEFVKLGTGTQTLGGANTYTGITEIRAGVLTITNTSALGSTVGGTVLTGSRDGQNSQLSMTFAASDPSNPNIVSENFTMISDTANDQRTAIVNTTESTRLTGNIVVEGSGISQLTANQAAGDQFQINGNITGSGSGVFFLRGNGEMQVNGVINAPNMQLAKTENSLLILNSTGNNYGEASFVHGTVRTDVANALDPGAVLRMGQNGNANTLDLNGNNQTVAGVRINSGVTDGNARTITSNGGLADFTIDTPAADGGDYNYAGVIAGSINLTKSGPGTQVLAGFNTYSGITNVTGGGLYVNGTNDNGGTYTISSGATLGGTGKITTTDTNSTGNVTFAAGSNLVVGNSGDATGGHDMEFSLFGTGSAFTLNNSMTLSLDLWANLHHAGQVAGADQEESDVLIVDAATINLGGILNVNNPNNISSWLVGDTFDLFDWFTAPTGTFTSVNLPFLGGGLAWDTSNLYKSEGADPDLAGTIRVVSSGGLTPIETWRQANFGSAANTGNGADGADPDKDGIPNVMEYGLGMNPNVSTQTGLPTYSVPVNTGVISFGRNLAATDVTYIVQASSNLTSWTNLATRAAGAGSWSAIAPGAVVTDPGSGAVSVQDNVTVTAQPKRFMRVVVSNPLP